MAITSINASATAANTSGDITVSAGVPTTIYLRDADGASLPLDATARLEIKTSDGQYVTLAQLDTGRPALVIDGPGVYRVVKGSGSTAFGVDQAT